MSMRPVLFLGSKSPSRRLLLEEAGISFEPVPQSADEQECDWGMPLDKLVASIARYKMEHVILPEGKTVGETLCVLTADTLSQDADGAVQGKPTSREDAVEKIKGARAGTRLCTAFCLDRRVWRSNEWQIDQRIEQVVEARYEFVVPDVWIDRYLDNSIGLSTSNAIAIEGYGGQFLRSVSGSYTTIVGLPLMEVREALETLGFFSTLAP